MKIGRRDRDMLRFEGGIGDRTGIRGDHDLDPGLKLLYQLLIHIYSLSLSPIVSSSLA